MNEWRLIRIICFCAVCFCDVGVCIFGRDERSLVEFLGGCKE